MKTLANSIKLSHERQFNGEDWQAVAIDLWNELGSPEDNDETFNQLASGPDPGCDCGFCATAKWEN